MLAWNLAEEGLPITCLELIPGDAARRNAVLCKWGSPTQAAVEFLHLPDAINPVFSLSTIHSSPNAENKIA
jgi:hypothetical protein